MTRELVSIILFSLLVLYSDAQQIFVEENDPFMYLVCPANISFNTLNLVNTSSSEPQRPLVSCFSPQCKTYTGAVTLTLNNTHYIFQITRPSVYRLRGLTQVRCVYNDTVIGSQYEILVYAKPQNVSCDTPLLTNNNTSVSVTCQASKVYPRAGCQATVKDMALDFPIQLSFINNPMYVDSVEYYNSVCNWTSPLNNFMAGNYSLNVYFYLQNISGYSMTNMSTIASFNLSQPNVKLSSECFSNANRSDGFIRPGATAICLCFLDSIGYPPGSVKWFYKDLDVGIIVNSSTSSLQIGPTNNTLEYNCTSSTSLKSGNSFLNYTIQYAKGPSHCEVKPEDSNLPILDLCYNKSVNLSVVCSVNKSDVSPNIRSVIHINDSQSNFLTSESVETRYITKYKTSVTVPGKITIGCQVQNTAFMDITDNCSYSNYLQIIAPPQLAPLLNIKLSRKEDKVIVEENIIYLVECSIPDGVPPVNNVTLSCGNITESTQSGNNLTLPVRFTRNMTGQNCTCTGQHISKCYVNNVSQIQLNVTYATNVTKFTIDNTPSYIGNGTNIKLTCEADGNPPPFITIWKAETVLSQNISGYSVFLERTMTCRDTGIYECKAYNGNKGPGEQVMKKNTSIFVNCPLQLNNSADTDKQFSPKVGQSFVHTVTIYGYPEPNNITVSKSDSTTNNFKVQYQPNELPYFFVELKIENVKKFDFGNYTAIIYQSGNQSLHYSFSISEDNKPINDVDDSYLAAAVGGGIAAGLLVIIMLIVLVCIYQRGYCDCEKSKGFHNNDIKRSPSWDLNNEDVYFAKSKMKDKLINPKFIPTDNYKNYKDIVPTITTATAVPKNMYKPAVKPKPKVNNETTYYNFVEPIGSENKDLLNENVYANQGFSL